MSRELGDGRRDPYRGGAFVEMHQRPADRSREDRGYRSTSYYPQSSSLRYDGAQRILGSTVSNGGDRSSDTLILHRLRL